MDASAHGVSEADELASGDSDAAAPGPRRARGGSDAAASGDSDVEAAAPNVGTRSDAVDVDVARRRPSRATAARLDLVSVRPGSGPTRAHGRDSDCVGPGIGVWAGPAWRGSGSARFGSRVRAGTGSAVFSVQSTSGEVLCIKYSAHSSSGERGSESARFG